MKNSAVVARSIGLGCAVAFICAVLLIGGLFVGGVHLWESLFMSEPLSEQEDAKIAELKSSLADAAGHGADVSATARNMKHKSPDVGILITIRDTISFVEAEAVADRISRALEEQVPSDWDVTEQIFFSAVDGHKVDVNQVQLANLPDQFTLAAAAPQGTSRIQINGLMREVEWRNFDTTSCSEPFVLARQALSAVDGEKLAATLSVEVRSCEGLKPEGDHAFRVVARPEDAARQIDRLLELQPKLEGRHIDSMAITADNTLVLLETDFRHKEPGRAEDYQDLWPHGKVVMANSKMLIFEGKPTVK